MAGPAAPAMPTPERSSDLKIFSMRRLAIIDVERPEHPGAPRYFTDGVRDAHAVKVGMTNASLFAYVADGREGLKVLQLTSPDSQPKFYGFSPDPKPQLIAWYPTKGAAQSLSRGLERDRGVDESGNQIAIFGRIGSRPFHLDEMQRLYLDKDGKPWYVDDDYRSAPARTAGQPDSSGPPASAPATAPARGPD